MRTRIESIYVLTTVSVKKKILNEEIVDRKIAGLGVQMFSTVLLRYILQPAFREDIRREGMVEGIVKHLKKGDVALKTQCANALFKVCPTVTKIR